MPGFLLKVIASAGNNRRAQRLIFEQERTAVAKECAVDHIKTPIDVSEVLSP